MLNLKGLKKLLKKRRTTYPEPSACIKNSLNTT